MVLGWCKTEVLWKFANFRGLPVYAFVGVLVVFQFPMFLFLGYEIY